MKKIIFVMPLMAISLLASCNKGGGGGGGGEEDDPSSTAKITLSGYSRNCKLVCDGTDCLIGNSILIPAGITTTLTVEPVNNYLPVFNSNLTFTGEAYEKTYIPGKKEIVVNVAKGDELTIKATTDKTKEDKLEDYSWALIKEISEGGVAPAVFTVGDEKTVTINNKDHKARIIDFDHDLDPNGNSIGITFEFANVFTGSDGNLIPKEWNNDNGEGSTNYDYRESTLNNFLNNDVLNMLPSSEDVEHPDLKEVIKPVDKKVGVNESETKGSQYYTATSFDGEDYPYPYLFPLSYDEITIDRERTYVTSNEGDTYQYYKDHPEVEYRKKRKVGGEGVFGEIYWLRSPHTEEYFFKAWQVNYMGKFTEDFVYRHAEGQYAVAAAFCI